jgi:exodeoxyribonuclease VII large subunit
MPSPYEDVPVLGVKETITLCNSLFEELSLQVEGEVANYSVNRGKFVFFDLKDVQGDARLGCFMMAYQQNMPVEDGMRIVVHATAGLYVKSGQFRLSVQRIELKGEGTLKRSFELLKAKLEAEGLFSPDRKRLIPAYPTTIGVISSEEAAGFGDFMRIAKQRSCGLRFVLAHVAVQGVQAESEICQAFEYLNGYKNPDVIVLIRGGGSMEDLHAFNSEAVARAIVRSKAPVVVGVGHERDVTIADFCADLRAATPSNAAQLAVPDRNEIAQMLKARAVERKHRITSLLNSYRHGVMQSIQGMNHEVHYGLQAIRARVQASLGTIEALAPERVLARGYSITCTLDGKPITSVKGLAVGSDITTRLADGSFTSRINETL